MNKMRMMTVVVVVLLGLCACAKRQDKLKKMVADLAKISYDISLPTGTFVVSAPAPVPVPVPAPVAQPSNKVEAQTVASTTTEIDQYVSYGSVYGGEVSKPVKSALSPVKVNPKPKLTHPGVVTKPAVSLTVSSTTVAKLELTMLQKVGRLVKIVLAILVLMGLIVYKFEFRKSGKSTD